jgi:hypothetical protein
VARYLWRTGFRRGILGGSRAWTTVAIVAGGWQLLRRLRGKEPEVVFAEELHPGEALLITAGPEPT